MIHTSPSKHCHFYTVCTAVLTLDFILLQITFVSYICGNFVACLCISIYSACSQLDSLPHKGTKQNYLNLMQNSREDGNVPSACTK